MLDVMRRNAQSWLIRIIFLIIIAVFVLFWTGPGQKGAPLQEVAIVDGEKIVYSEYQRSYNNLLNLYQQIYKDALSGELIKMLKLEEKALDSLIESRLLLNEAGRLDLEVSDAELVDSISRYPAFQKDNAFNKSLYLSVLSAKRLTPEQFEEGQRKSLLIGKVEGIIRDGVKVSDDDIKEAYLREKEKIGVEMVRLDPKSFLKEAAVSSDEASAYYSANKESFRQAAKAKLEFIKITFRDAEESISTKEEELRGYYEKNKDLFKNPDGSEKPFSDALAQVAVMYRNEKGDQVLREWIYRVRDEAVKAKSLLDAAVKEKLQVYTTDFIGAGDVVEEVGPSPEFYREAFRLGAGEMSQPVKIDKGYVIVRVVEKQEEKLLNYEEVKDRVAAAVSEKKAGDIAFAKAEGILNELKAGNASISKLPYKMTETGLFGRRDGIPGIGGSGEVTKQAFLLSKESPFPAKPIVSDKSVYIIKLKEHVIPGEEGLKAEEQAIRQRLRQEKGDAAMKEWLSLARSRAEIKIYEEYIR